MATTGYQATLEANGTQISYAPEATFKTLPAVQFQAIRYTGETLSGSKSRQRPSEINLSRESSAAVTVSETAGGSVSGALSFGTYDAFIESVLNNSWQALQAINGVAADISLTNLTSTTATLASTTANKFLNLAVGQWVRLLGFTNTANNNYYRISAKASNVSLTLVSPFAATVTETPTGTNAKVRASTITNGSAFQSLYLQQQLASNMFLRYPGAYVTGMSVDFSLGKFAEVSFDVVATEETSATTNASTGAVLAAPVGEVHNTIGGFGGVLFGDVPSTVLVDSVSLKMTNVGAAGEYGLGSSVSQGVTSGVFETNGTVKLGFKDFTQYALFKSETAQRIAIVTKDATGQAYVLTIFNAYIMNPKVDASGPGTALYATFDLEAAPQSGGGTVQWDRLVAA